MRRRRYHRKIEKIALKLWSQGYPGEGPYPCPTTDVGREIWLLAALKVTQNRWDAMYWDEMYG